MRSAWPPETLSGKISMVDPDRKLVVVETPDGIPFDMVDRRAGVGGAAFPPPGGLGSNSAIRPSPSKI
jgi:hypothetical protein